MKLMPAKEMWFNVPDDEEKAEIKIRHLNNSKVQSITQGVSENRTILKDGRMEVVAVSNQKEILEALCVNAIRNWKNVSGLDGQPLECTDANKRLFIAEVDGFLEFVNQCRNDLADHLRKEEDLAAKN